MIEQVADISAEDRALIETIRSEIRALDYTPLDDTALIEMHNKIEDAVEDAESEGVHRTPKIAAFHVMLIEEGAPKTIRKRAVSRYAEAIAAKARAAEAVTG